MDSGGARSSTADTSAFAAVVTALLAERRDYPELRIDPRPTADDTLIVRRDPDRLVVTPSERASITAQQLAARRETLKRLHVPEDDGVLPDDCGGRLLPDFDADHQYHNGCPASHRTFATIGRPRRGDESDATAADTTRWTSRVTITDIQRGGINIELLYYVLAREKTRWIFVKSKHYAWIE